MRIAFRMQGTGGGERVSSTMMRLGLIVAAAVVAADQASKWLMLTVVMDPPRVITVTPFFNLVLGWNRGISFGLLGGGAVAQWLLVVVAVAIAGGLVLWLRRVRRPWFAAAIGLVIGGAVGNVVDRVLHEAVVDFLDFHLGGYHWPAFNLADTAISVGVALIVIDSLFVSRRSS